MMYPLYFSDVFFSFSHFVDKNILNYTYSDDETANESGFKH